MRANSVDLRQSKVELEFLDLLLTIKHNNIESSIYKKATDKHLYLHLGSDHPNSAKKKKSHTNRVRHKSEKTMFYTG